MADLLTAMATKIAAKTGRTLGTDMFTSPEYPPDNLIPRDCVFMWESGGFAMGVAEMKPVTATDKRVWERAHVHVVVRKNLRDYTAGAALSNSIIAALNYVELTVDGIIFKWCKATKPKAQYRGPNTEQLLIFEMVFEVSYQVYITANTP